MKIGRSRSSSKRHAHARHGAALDAGAAPPLYDARREGARGPVGPDGGRAAETDGARAAGLDRDEALTRRRGVRTYLLAAAEATVVIPALFYLHFGEVDAFALSFTVFIVVLCLLVALGLYVSDRPGAQAPAAPAPEPTSKFGALAGRVGSFWLFACAFGPFFGWVAANAYTLTEANWRWRYVVRVVLCVALPVLTALPLFAYVRGKYRHVALSLLMCVTALPVWSGLNTMLDLREGPKVRSTTGLYDPQNNSFYPLPTGHAFRLTTLAHTGRTIKIERDPTAEGKD